MNSVTGKTNLKVNLGVGGVDMPSMRSAVNDNVGFEIEENEETAKDEKDKRLKSTKGVKCMAQNQCGNASMEIKNRRNAIPEGRRFSSRFPASRSRVLDS